MGQLVELIVRIVSQDFLVSDVLLAWGIVIDSWDLLFGDFTKITFTSHDAG